MAKARILLTDDDIDLRDLYKLRLESEGFEVLTASDGEESIGIIREEMPDLIITGIMIPKMSGLDLLSELKKDPILQEIPVIILTALLQDVIKVRSLMYGADDFLSKSEVEPDEVVYKVHRVLEAKKISKKRKAK